MSDPLPIAVAAANPHFERIGGHAGVVRLVDAFYATMQTLPEARTIRAMHDANLAETKRVLVRYLVEWLVGARPYSEERGAPALRRRHLRFAIDTAARDAWLACMRRALDDTCPDAALRDELFAAFAKIADHLGNAPSESQHPSP